MRLTGMFSFIRVVGALTRCPDSFLIRLDESPCVSRVDRELGQSDESLWRSAIESAQLKFIAQGDHKLVPIRDVVIVCLYPDDEHRDEFNRTLLRMADHDPDERMRAFATDLLLRRFWCGSVPEVLMQ